jgi:hypothetical protein
LISKWKDVGREEDRRGGLCVARGLGETEVKAATSRSRNVGKNTVECNPTLFVSIESFIEKVTQKASVLRNAFSIDTLCWSDRIGRVLSVRGKVANCSEASAGYYGIGDNVNVFVNLSGLEAAVQEDMPVAGDEFAIDGVRKLPLGGLR